MENYDRNSSKLFEMSFNECNIINNDFRGGNLFYVKKYFKRHNNIEVQSYQLRTIGSNNKRNKFDNAVLLVLFLENGKVLAKRHNNSQWLRI